MCCSGFASQKYCNAVYRKSLIFLGEKKNLLKITFLPVKSRLEQQKLLVLVEIWKKTLLLLLSLYSFNSAPEPRMYLEH